MIERQKGGDTRTHGVAEDISSIDAEMVEQRPCIFRHGWSAITFRLVELLAQPVAAIVKGNDPAAASDQRPNPAWVNPVGGDIGGKTVDEQDQVSLALIPISDAHAIRLEDRHSSLPFRTFADYAHARSSPLQHKLTLL